MTSSETSWEIIDFYLLCIKLYPGVFCSDSLRNLPEDFWIPVNIFLRANLPIRINSNTQILLLYVKAFNYGLRQPSWYGTFGNDIAKNLLCLFCILKLPSKMYAATLKSFSALILAVLPWSVFGRCILSNNIRLSTYFIVTFCSIYFNTICNRSMM